MAAPHHFHRLIVVVTTSDAHFETLRRALQPTPPHFPSASSRIALLCNGGPILRQGRWSGRPCPFANASPDIDQFIYPCFRRNELTTKIYGFSFSSTTNTLMNSHAKYRRQPYLIRTPLSHSPISNYTILPLQHFHCLTPARGMQWVVDD
jgi:hypothetical protein